VAEAEFDPSPRQMDYETGRREDNGSLFICRPSSCSRIRQCDPLLDALYSH
jgi:hypothetical protein